MPVRASPLRLIVRLDTLFFHVNIESFDQETIFEFDWSLKWGEFDE